MDNRAQVATELTLVIIIVIIAASSAAAILKGLLTQNQTSILAQTNSTLHQTA
ncbi:MAG: hypothetical protein AABX02_00670 [archaeon]